jgi:acid phosphatase family membrane protein YuiD
MDYIFIITPFAAWLTAGTTKFIVNTYRSGKKAAGLIGYGGFPSNHSAIVSSVATMIALKEGVDSPAFGAAIALAFIVVLDANSLRQQIGRQATAINKLTTHLPEHSLLRERIGHTRLEIAGGLLVGIAVAWLLYLIVPLTSN